MANRPIPHAPLPYAPEGLAPIALVAMAAKAAREDATEARLRPCEPEGRCYE